MKFKVGDEFIGKKAQYTISIIDISGTKYTIELTRKDCKVTTFSTNEETLEQYTRRFTKLDKAMK